jgi:hypothetical protein
LRRRREPESGAFRLYRNAENFARGIFEFRALALEAVYLQEAGAQQRRQQQAQHRRQDQLALLFPALEQAFLYRPAVALFLLQPRPFPGFGAGLFLGGLALALLLGPAPGFLLLAPELLGGLASRDFFGLTPRLRFRREPRGIFGFAPRLFRRFPPRPFPASRAAFSSALRRADSSICFTSSLVFSSRSPRRRATSARKRSAVAPMPGGLSFNSMSIGLAI